MVFCIDVLFNGVKVAMLAHIVFSLWRAAVSTPPGWLSNPIVRAVDDTGMRFLVPFRLVFDRVGISRMTGALDLSPILAFFILNWAHSALITLFLPAGVVRV